MRQLLDDAIMICRQEADSFLTIVAPLAIFGPVLVIVAATGFIPALVSLPIFMLLLLATYAACIRAAALILRNLAPDPSEAWLDALRALPNAIVAGGVPLLGLAAAIGCAISISGDGLPLIGLAVAGAGVVALVHWVLRHAYDQSLVLAHSLPPAEATRVGPLLAALDERWTPSLLAAVTAPLIFGAFVAWVASEFLAPAVGGAVFILATALWLPFPALALTIDCDRLLADATEPAQRAAI